MQELVKLGEKTYCLPGVINIGIYLLNERDICLIDSGSDKTYAKKVVKILDENNWNLKTIINTHSHADHIGGNKILQEKYNCDIYCKKEEVPFIRYPILEPALLYGANPINDLKCKFLMADESNCKDIDNVNLEGLSIINLPGHSINMIGVLTDDNVLFVGDAYTSKEILEKYSIQYIYDVEKYIETINYLKTFYCSYYVPSHGKIDKDISELLNVNIDNCNNIKMLILEFTCDAIRYDDLLKMIFNHHHINMNMTQYYLIGTTIKSFLEYMYKNNLIEFVFENNLFIIKKVA